jgi:hypothetical protein
MRLLGTPDMVWYHGHTRASDNRGWAATPADVVPPRPSGRRHTTPIKSTVYVDAQAAGAYGRGFAELGKVAQLCLERP